MRLHWSPRPSEATTDHDCKHECGGAGVYVHRGSPGEVDHAQFVDPSALVTIEVEHPVRDREVNNRCPDSGKNEPRTELRPIRDRSGDETDGDAGEHRLECNECHCRHPRLRVIDHETLEPDVLRHVSKQPGLAIRVTERH